MVLNVEVVKSGMKMNVFLLIWRNIINMIIVNVLLMMMF